MAKAVLFDFDGTLAKTMEDNFKAWQNAVSGYGIDLKPEDYYPFEGLNVHDFPKVLFGKYKLETPDENEVVRKKEEYYLKHHRFELYPGVEDLITALREKRVPIAVVTAGQRERLEHSVPAGFLDNFEAVVTGEAGTNGKPSPDPYLLGAEKLNVKPEDCVVVENAPLGIESAKKAGAYCIALATTLDKKHLKDADEILDSFAALSGSEQIKQLLG